MDINQGFLVRNDRFSLTEPDRYIITGWLVPGTELEGKIGHKDLVLEVTALSDSPDERYGGSLTRIDVKVPGDIKAHEQLKLYAVNYRGRHLSWSCSGKHLKDQGRPIHYYIEDYTVNRRDDFVRIQGWAVARDRIRLGVYAQDRSPLKARTEWYKRYDTVELFDEYPVRPDNGFNVEIRPIPPGRIYLRLKNSDDSVILLWPTGRYGTAVMKAGHLAVKSAEALRYNGIRTFAGKAWNRLFNPAMRSVNYSDWIRRHLPSEKELNRQRSTASEDGPLISVVVPCFRTPEEYLAALVESVRKQTYEHWELILSDGSGPDSPIAGKLDGYAALDERIRVLHHENRMGIAENTNAGIEASRGEWTAFADHDDVLVPSALYEVAACVREHPGAELVYTDEDKVGTGEKYLEPNMKPDYAPDFLDSVNYICHLLVIKRTLLERAGYLDPAYNGAQDYDLVLRCTEQAEEIRHVPKVLYHWRFFEGSTAANPESKTWAFEAGRRALDAHLRRMGWPAHAETGEYPGLYRVVWEWPDHPLVTIIIPNKDHIRDLAKCLDSMDRHVRWPSLEILIVENNSEEEETFQWYRDRSGKDTRVRVVTWEGEFNYSAINNFGVSKARGEYLLLLNNDTEFLTDAVTLMMGFAQRPDVGAVGARLYYGDDTIQHAGAVLGWGGVAGHAFVNQKRGSSGYQHRIICQQNYSAVTAACMLVRRDVFRETGGFTEELAVAFNDIDLCLKIRKAGYLIVYEPSAELYHYESKSRGYENTPEKKARFRREVTFFRKRWQDVLDQGDPYYNPNLSMITQDFSLRRD